MMVFSVYVVCWVLLGCVCGFVGCLVWGGFLVWICFWGVRVAFLFRGFAFF